MEKPLPKLTKKLVNLREMDKDLGNYKLLKLTQVETEYLNRPITGKRLS